MALDYYKILDVSYNASPEDVKLAYRKLAKMYHPDVNANDTEKAEMFKVVSEAYNVLSDEDRKAAYDLRLLLGVYEEQSADVRYTYDTRTRSYRTRQYRRREPITYSRKTYITVSLFLLFVAAAIWVVPLGLTWYSSSYNYNKGVELYEKGEYFTALNTLDRSINEFGSKNIEACKLAIDILYHHFRQYSYAIEYANRGLKLAENDQDRVHFFYMKAMCLKASTNYYSAIQQLEEAKLLNTASDSLYYALANIQAFNLDNYGAALENYNALLEVNGNYTEAYYERAYVYFRQGENSKALLDIDHYLSLNAEDGRANLLKGQLELRNGNQEEACFYIKKASLTHEREASKLSYYCN